MTSNGREAAPRGAVVRENKDLSAIYNNQQVIGELLRKYESRQQRLKS